MDIQEIAQKFINTIIIIQNKYDYNLFNRLQNHYVQTLGIALNCSSLSPLVSVPYLTTLLLRVPNIYDFPYSMVSKLNLSSFTIESLHLQEIRYNFVDHPNLRQLRIEAPVRFFYSRIFNNIPNLQEFKCKNFRLNRLPKSIAQLQQLETLELTNCNLFGIPSILFNLSSLKHLLLAENCIKTIPNGIKSLGALQTLDLHDNNCNNVPSFFQDITTLREIKISNNRFVTFPYIIFQIPNLILFDFRNNSIQEDYINNLIPQKSIQILSEYDVLHYNQEEMKMLQKAKELLFDEIPDDYICPISKNILIDPVLVSTGETYERHFIEKWFKDHDTDPLTNQIIVDKEVRSNLNLKRIIIKYLNY